MSIYVPNANSALNGGAGAATYLALPAGASTKGASVSAIFGMWVQTPALTGSVAFKNNRNHCVMAKDTGNASGNGGRITFNQSGASANFQLYNGGSALITSASLNGLTPGLPLLLLIIINSTHTHFVACHPGGTPVVNSQAVTAPYTTNMTTVQLVNSFGAGSSGSVNGWYGPIEEAFMLTRSGADIFPQVAGVPDETLIRQIANGVQDLDGLNTLLNGTRKFRYRMLHSRDFTDAWGLAANLTITNEDKPTGKLLTNASTLRPAALNPRPSFGGIAQCKFGTPGVAATATATIKTPSGTYNGITPAAIQARLVKEDGTVLSGFDWTTVATPSGGVWPEGQFTSVPMTAGWLFMDMRAVDGSNAQIGAAVAGMTTGAGFHFFIGSGQSQFEITYTDGGLAIPSGIRVLALKGGLTTCNRMLLGSADEIDAGNSIGIGWGMRQAAIEINTLFPGIPIEFSTIVQSGTSLTEFGTGGGLVGKWANIASYMGVIQPFVWMPCGHSQAADGNYQTQFADMLTQGAIALGQPLIYCLIPVPRYKGAGASIASGNALAVSWSRRGMRAWHEANRGISYWGGSLSVIRTSLETGGSDPHPEISALGSGRTGAIMAWRGMEAIRAVPHECVGLVGATKESAGTKVRLTFGRVSNYPVPA